MFNQYQIDNIRSVAQIIEDVVTRSQFCIFNVADWSLLSPDEDAGGLSYMELEVPKIFSKCCKEIYDEIVFWLNDILEELKIETNENEYSIVIGEEYDIEPHFECFAHDEFHNLASEYHDVVKEYNIFEGFITFESSKEIKTEEKYDELIEKLRYENLDTKYNLTNYYIGEFEDYRYNDKMVSFYMKEDIKYEEVKELFKVIAEILRN